jgi:hypothetical protein
VRYRVEAKPTGTSVCHCRMCQKAVGSFDDPNAVAPIAQYGVESRVHWLAEALAAPAAPTDEWLAGKKISSVGARQHPDHET